jgi:YHS domain-containing protein
VVAFLFADLIVIPIVLIYRKYYGGAFTARIVGLMFVSMIIAALAVDALFSGLGLIPHVRPARADIFSSVKLDYKFVLNVLATALFAVLFALTMRRGATDPVCGMRVDRHKALRSEGPNGTAFFCSEHCRDAYEVGARDHVSQAPDPAGVGAPANSL